MTESVYVHIDTTSNAVLTKGLTATDFANSIVHFPQNLLLLDPSASAGEYESHTGLKVIRGTENIQRFFSSSRNRRGFDELKWIDFTDLTMLKELTPLEISELLYFGHMKTHLHSPFFYKLQNNFVYFDLNDQLKMRNLMQEGIIFSFDQVGLIDGKYRIPIYVIEDYIWKLKGTRYREEEIIATLIYSVTDRHWQLVEDADLSYLPLK
ncbi:TPA: hypothetical protein IWO12_000744 [Enterococcus faecium]|nr:hypothetical protein [Enterococcus faecium]